MEIGTGEGDRSASFLAPNRTERNDLTRDSSPYEASNRAPSMVGWIPISGDSKTNIASTLENRAKAIYFRFALGKKIK